MCVVGLSFARNIKWTSFYKSDEKSTYFAACFVFKDSLYSLVGVLLILFYQLVINPCFHKYIPSMLKRIGVGLVFSLFTTVYSVIMLVCKNYFLFDITSYKVVIVSEIFYGTATALIIPTSLAFTIAQSPHEMRGLMVGLWYAAHGVGYILNISIKYIFECENDTTSH